MFPFYPVYQDGGLVGYGLADYGRGSNGPQRNWYEFPNSEILDVSKYIYIVL